jgi:hypothetical protein
MISSEVQRTLVKSPPELWAELSDPASLSRHMGELGEIRITRTEPERKIEWEAEKTVGTVQIKPSGWGTRVTLTVTREMPEPEPGGGPAGEEPLAPADEEPLAAADEGPAPTAAAEPQIAGAGPWEAPAEPAAVDGETAWPVEDEPPAIDGETAWPIENEPAFEPQTPAATAAKAGPPPEQNIAPVETDAEPQQPDAEAGRFAWLAYEADQPEPRRGFFARLFGRRRRHGLPEPQAPEALEPSETPEGAQAAEGELTEIVPQETTDAAALPEEPPRDDPAGPAHAPVAIAEPQSPAPADAAGSNDTPMRAGPNAEHADPESGSGDIAAELKAAEAELKAAEEIAMAEVTAVLSGVLDRLGAAHHRPFSRA